LNVGRTILAEHSWGRMTEDESLLGTPGVCPEHGDGSFVECNICGVEFCAECHPGSRICTGCAVQSDEPGDEELEEVDVAGLDGIDDVMDDDDDFDDDEIEDDVEEDW